MLYQRYLPQIAEELLHREGAAAPRSLEYIALKEGEEIVVRGWASHQADNESGRQLVMPQSLRLKENQMFYLFKVKSDEMLPVGTKIPEQDLLVETPDSTHRILPIASGALPVAIWLAGWCWTPELQRIPLIFTCYVPERSSPPNIRMLFSLPIGYAEDEPSQDDKSEQVKTLIALAKEGKKDDFKDLGRAVGVPEHHLEELWQGTRSKLHKEA